MRQLLLVSAVCLLLFVGFFARDSRSDNNATVSYEEALIELYETLGREYPAFGLKGINWKKVGEELLPRAKRVRTDEQFGLLCMELVVRLEDSHASLLKVIEAGIRAAAQRTCIFGPGPRSHLKWKISWNISALVDKKRTFR